MEKQDNKRSVTKIENWLSAIHLDTSKDRDYLVENLSMLIASGMTILSAIDAIAADIHNKSMKKVLATLRDDIQEGLPLWKAFERSRIFHDHAISLVRLGEETGKLSDNLRLIADQEEKDRIFRSKIKSATMYPAFVLSLTVIIGVTIAWFVLPRLATVFEQMRVELPIFTKWLIAAGDFLGEYGTIAVPIFFIALVSLVFFIFYFSKTKFIGQAIIFMIPGIKKLFQEVELARFGYILGTLLQAGVLITQALESLHNATIFSRYKKFYAHLRDSAQEGNSFQKSFTSYKKSSELIPTTIQRLIVTGEQSGNLSKTLLKISTKFEERTESTTKNLTVILEPILLFIVWFGVVAVALAVILPIYSLIGDLDTGPPQQTRQNVPTENVASSAAEPAATSVPEELSPTLQIIHADIGRFNVRDTSSVDGDVIGHVFSGESYEHVDEKDGWYEIVLEGGESGWIFEDYVNVNVNEIQ